MRAAGGGDDVANRPAVLSRQAFGERETGIDRVELGRIVLGRLERARDLGGEVHGLYVQRRCALRKLAQQSVEFFNARERGAGSSQRTGGAPFFRGECFARAVQRNRDALDVIEIRPPFREPLDLARLETRFFDFAHDKARIVVTIASPMLVLRKPRHRLRRFLRPRVRIADFGA